MQSDKEKASCSESEKALKSVRERRKEKRGGQENTGRQTFKHSRMGIVSCINSIGGLLILAGCIFYAFMARGNAHGIIGGLAVLSPGPVH